MCQIWQTWSSEPKLVLGIDLEENIALCMGMCMRYEAGCAVVVSIGLGTLNGHHWHVPFTLITVVQLTPNV